MTTIDRRGLTVDASDPVVSGDPNPGLAIKAPVRAATTAAITLSGLQTVDDIALAEGDRVLVKDQADQTTNGIYNASSGNWTRAIDADGNDDWADGTVVPVGGGTTNQHIVFMCTAVDTIVLGTSALPFVAVSIVPQGSSGIGANVVPRFVGASGGLLKGSAVTIDDNGWAIGLTKISINTASNTLRYSGSNTIDNIVRIDGGAGNDVLALTSAAAIGPYLNFGGPNSGGNAYRFASIAGTPTVLTAGAEEGVLRVLLAKAGANVAEFYRFNPTGLGIGVTSSPDHGIYVYPTTLGIRNGVRVDINTTLSGSQGASGFSLINNIDGASTDHARGFQNIAVIGGTVTYDAMAFNITLNSTIGGEAGLLIGGITLAAGGNAWVVDHVTTVSLGAPNGNLSQTQALNYTLVRNVKATSTGYDRGIVINNAGLYNGVGEAFTAAGFDTGIQLVHGPEGNMLDYIKLQGITADFNVLRAIRVGTTNVLIKTNGQGLRITTGDGTLSAAADFQIDGRLYVKGTSAVAAAVAEFTPSGGSGAAFTLETSNIWTFYNAAGQTLLRVDALGQGFLGQAGALTGKLLFAGATSGGALIVAQAIAGTPTLTLPNADGTFVISASAPLARDAATGNLSITGAAGQVLAGATPAFTATPTLGASGTLGSITFGNATSGLVTLQPVTGALGTVTLSLPAATDTLVGKATTDELTNKTLTSSVGKGTWTASGTWTLPALTLGGTISGGGNNINNVIIGAVTPLAGSFTTLTASTSLTITSANAAALAVGRLGATTPALLVDASTATSITGISIKSAAAGGHVALAAIGETNVNLILNSAGSGTIELNPTGTGIVHSTRNIGVGATGNVYNSSVLTGAYIKTDGLEFATGGICAFFNRNNSVAAGDIIALMRDGTQIGSLATDNSGLRLTSATSILCANDVDIASGHVLKVNATQVIGARITGYAAMTGTANKATTYDTSTITTAQLAGRVMQLQADLTTHGVIGA